MTYLPPSATLRLLYRTKIKVLPEFKHYLNSIGTKHILNAVATPRANGQIERYNRTILSSLAPMNHNHHEADWDLNLPRLQWSLNNTFNKGIGKAPAEVVFGQRTSNSPEGIVETSCIQDRGQIRQAVKETTEIRQNNMKERFDSKRAPSKVFRRRRIGNDP